MSRDAGAREMVMALPDMARLVWRVVRDERVPKGVRYGFWGLAAYLALPFDIVPDWIPVLGQLDDVVVMSLGIRTLLRRVPEPVIREHWTGERDMLERVLGRKLRDPAGNGH